MTRKLTALLAGLLLAIALLTARYGSGTAHNWDGTHYRFAYIAWDWGGYEVDSPAQFTSGFFVCNNAPIAPLFPDLTADC